MHKIKYSIFITKQIIIKVIFVDSVSFRFSLLLLVPLCLAFQHTKKFCGSPEELSDSNFQGQTGRSYFETIVLKKTCRNNA